MASRHLRSASFLARRYATASEISVGVGSLGPATVVEASVSTVSGATWVSTVRLSPCSDCRGRIWWQGDSSSLAALARRDGSHRASDLAHQTQQAGTTVCDRRGLWPITA